MIEGETMAKRRVPADAAKKGHTWPQRRDRIQSIAVYREVAKMATRVAKDEGLSVADLLEPVLRGPLESKYRKILQRELEAMGQGG